MNRLKWQWDENPMLPVLLCLSAGIWPAGILGSRVFLALLPASVILLLLYLIRDRHLKLRAVFRTLLAGILCWIAGAGLTVFRSKPEALPEHSAFYGMVTEAGPLKENGSRRCLARIVRIRNKDGRWEELNGNAVLWIKCQAAAGFRSGHGILVSIPLRGIPAPAIPGEFNAQKWLHSQGIHWQAFISDDYILLPPKKNTFSIRSIANSCRIRLEQVFIRNLPQKDDAAMLSALLLGIRRTMDPDLKEAYAAAGLTHILAVSGMHVALIFGFLSFVLQGLKKLPGGRLLFSLSITSALWFYALITGLSPSVLRAVCLFSIMQFSDVLRRPSLPLNNLCFASIILIMADPDILFDLGYQLSFAAVYGIISFQKAFSFPGLIFHYRILNAMKENLAVTMAASLGTLPIILFHFHRFPVYFLISNLIAVPFSNLLIYTGLGLIVLNPFSLLAKNLGCLLHHGFNVLNCFVDFINHLPYSSINHIYPSVTGFILLIILTMLLQILLISRKIRYLNYGLAALLGICLIQIPENLAKRRKLDGWYPVQYRKELFLFSRTGKNGVLKTLSPGSAEPRFLQTGFELNTLSADSCSCKILAPASGQKPASRFCISEGIRFVWLNHFLKIPAPVSPLKIDYLFVGKAGEKSLEKSLQLFHPKIILVNRPLNKFQHLQKKHPAVCFKPWNQGVRLRQNAMKAEKEQRAASPEPGFARFH